MSVQAYLLYTGSVWPGDLYNNRPWLAYLNILHGSRDMLVSALVPQEGGGGGLVDAWGRCGELV